MSKDKKYRVITIISICGFILCTLALLYPVVSDRWNRYRDSQLMTEYSEMVSAASTDEISAVRKAEDYNRYLKLQDRNIVTDADYEPDDYYETLLNLTNNGMMGYIEIPKIDITEPIYHYSHDISLGKGVGHIHGSSLPVGGKSTHSVLTGHRGLPTQKLFSDLDKVSIGDKFYIHVLGSTMVYKVYKIKEIEPTDVSVLFIEDGKDLVTLVTCTPYGVNTERLLVMGERVPDKELSLDSNGNVIVDEHGVVVDNAVWVFIGFMIFIFYLFISTTIKNIIYIHRKKKGGSG